MKNEKLLNAIGEIDDDLISGAMNNSTAKKRIIWFKWGTAAACLCLIAAGAAFWMNRPELPGNVIDGGTGGETVSGGGNTGGNPAPNEGGDAEGEFIPCGDGEWPEGMDPVVASVAIQPAGESLTDVANATLVSITEEDAKNIEGLGTYLPDTLPENCWYGPAGYYETTMKDGTRYHMLRVTYESGQRQNSPITDEMSSEAHATFDGSVRSAFLWMIWDHRPDNTHWPIYQPNEVTAQLLEQTEGGFYIDYGSVYVGIEQMEISTEELLDIIRSVG